MGIYDRDYVRPAHEHQYSMGMGFGGLPPVIKWLLIINFTVFLIINLIPDIGGYIYYFGAVFPRNPVAMIQVWRLITYQFLHSGIWHLVFNLMVLYFMGPFVEHAWGSKAFLKFYLICGAAGGIVYTLLVASKLLSPLPMVGASGAIYGVVAVVAVMYPRMRVLLYGIIPMSMIWLVVLIIILSLLNIASGKNVGGEAAHLSGLAAGFVYIKFKPWLTQFRMERRKGTWTKKIERERNFVAEVDRILDKVHQEGINALSQREKEILQEATRLEQENMAKRSD